MCWPVSAFMRSAVESAYLGLADLLDGLQASAWDAPSLCAGWRVREVVAHLTMPVRYSPEDFQAELRDCGGNFTRLSNRVASRDGALPAAELLGNLRDEVMHQWVPPEGGQIGALNHVVIHGLDITVPLEAPPQASDAALHAVLKNLTSGGTHAYFGFDLDGLHMRATDIDWTFGSGTPIVGRAGDLVLLMCGRALPPGRISPTPPNHKETP